MSKTPQKPTAEWLIKNLELQPHRPGGYIRETYRSEEHIPHSALPHRYSESRTFGTQIYYLVLEGYKCALHRGQSDEVLHFYQGGPVTISMISPEGETREITMGPDIMAGHVPQFTVPRGHWFGSKPNPGSEYALMGCGVAPSFSAEDCEVANREEMLKKFPQARDIILKLTDPS